VCARRVKEVVLATTTHIGMIRERATEICIGLQDLGLPALVTLEIVDQSMPDNDIRMWAKWELITAAKHFHERRGIEPGTSIVAPRSRLSLFLRRFMR
jgi:hypothetical protein